MNESQAGEPLAAVLREGLGMPQEQVRRLVEAGAVYVDGRRCKLPDRALQAGQSVMAVLEEAGQGALQEGGPLPPLVVLFEDSQLVAVNKPPGIPAQPTASREGLSLLDEVSRHLGRPAGLVHRLDRDTSGVTVFGKTGEATSHLAAQFREGTARKQYLAACAPGLAARGSIDLPLSRDPSRPGRRRASARAHGVAARTDFERLYGGPEFCLVSLSPRTGRTHQLRAHLAAVGAPILGDALYGGPSNAAGLPAPRCLLHARALWLHHPEDERELLIEAPVPADLKAFFEQAGVATPKAG